MRLVWRVVCIIEGGAAVNRTVCMSRTACCLSKSSLRVCVLEMGGVYSWARKGGVDFLRIGSIMGQTGRVLPPKIPQKARGPNTITS